MKVIQGPWQGQSVGAPTPPEGVDEAYDREEALRRAYRQPWLRLKLDLDDNVDAETTWQCCECEGWFRLGELFYVRGERTVCVWCRVQ